VSEFETASVLVSFESLIVGRDTNRCGLLIAKHRSDLDATQRLACLLSIGELHNLPLGERHVFLNVQFSVLPAHKRRPYQIPTHKCERGCVAGLHGSLGHPPTGRFFETSFRIASFQSPSIFRTSGLGPGLRRFDFVGLSSFRLGIGFFQKMARAACAKFRS
jgi:hypothetical protein